MGKVKFALIIAALMCAECSKYDDTKVWNELNSLDSRVEKLEALCSQMNTNILSLQTIVAALQNNDGITNVYQLPNGEGYTITFTFGKTITIYNGADGKDGTNGKDGADGKDGKDGDTMFSSVVENEDNVVFTLADGTQITIDKSKSLSISFEASEIGVEPGKSKEMTYTLTGASANVKVKVIAQDGWSAKLTSSSQTGGVIRVAAPYASAESEVTVLVSDGNYTIMSSFSCVRKDKDADLTVVVSDKVSILMVWVDEDVQGFIMGAADLDASSIEKPQHRVYLSGFYICKYEVTQSLWEEVMGNNPSIFKGDGNLPVEYVSWDDCQDFIVKLNQMTKRQFRLPTEAEWEYAARGGRERKGYRYSGSDEVNEVAWYKYNSDSISHVVGTKAPNELGIYDMSGNVWEWCQDYYGSYSSDTQTDPTGPKTGTERTYRGGGWDYSVVGQQSTHRGMSPSTRKYKSIGFSLAMSAE